VAVDLEASIEQVAGILVREDFRFTTSKDRRSYRLLFDSAAVFIDFDTWQEGVVVTVHSPVLQGIDEDGPGAAVALNRLNELNRRHFFTKFTFANGTLVAEYDLLGDQLKAVELVNAIVVVAAAADRLDDELREDLGGKPYVELLEERVEADAEPPDPDEP
jgi:Putative bacterial sensory transduction regulator